MQVKKQTFSKVLFFTESCANGADGKERFMKKKMGKLFSIVLAVLMIASSLVFLPVSAAESESTKSNSDLLWSLDFDGYDAYIGANSGATLSSYLKASGININIDAKDAPKLSITSGKLISNRAQWFHDYSGKEDAFGGLFYGIYEDADGTLLNEYYMDLDYTLVTPRETRSFSFTGTENGQTVTYTITTPYRGDSYFNPLSGGGFGTWLFKVSPTGYLYTASNVSTQTFKTADGANKNLGYFTYTKKVGNGSTSAKAPVTEAVWEEMRTNCGKDIVSVDNNNAQIFGYMHNYQTADNCYQLEAGKAYTIRVKFSVASDRKVTATTYVRPAGSSEPFATVGSVSYKYDSTSGNASSKTIRFSENYHDYSFDNMSFKTFSKCGDEHKFPTIESSVENENGFAVCDTIVCLSCGATWYEYREENTLRDYDFSAMTQEKYNSFVGGSDYKSSKNMTFSTGNGLSFESGELHLYTPMADTSKDYRLSFTMKLNQIPTDQSGSTGAGAGSSFLTDVTGGGFNMFLRYGRNSDYATTKEGWLRIRTSTNTNWTSMPTAFTLKEGETYDFEVIFRPSISKFDLYINGEYIGRGWIPTWDGSKRDIRIANQMSAKFVLKDYSVTQIEPVETYNLIGKSNLDYTLTRETLTLVNKNGFGALASNVLSDEFGRSTALYINDNQKVLGKSCYNLSFDFMMTDNGMYKDSSSTETTLWSLVSWVNNDTTGSLKYGTLVRIGGIDNDSSNPGFEKFFVVMDNNGAHTSSENNGNQAYTTSAGGAVAGYYSDKNSVYSFNAGEWVTFTLSVNTITNSAYLYANGELVGMAPVNAMSTSHYTSGSVTSKIRIGDSFRKLYYNWAIKDIDVEICTNTPVEVKDSGTIFNMDFGKTYKISGSVGAKLGSAASSAVTAAEVYKDTATSEGYTRFDGNAGTYAGSGATNLFNLSLTSQIGDNIYYNHLDGSKYAIETTFALFDRPINDTDRAELEAYNQANNKTATLPEKLTDTTVTVIRMSKYNDDNKVVLISNGANGLAANTVGGSIAIYTRDENGKFVRPNAWYTEDKLVDGRIPDDVWVNVKAVVDEEEGTFSVYVNGSIAFYLEGSTYRRAENLKFNVDTGASRSYITKYPNAPETVAWLAKPSYSTIPRTATVDGEVLTYGTSGLSLVSYLRFFQGALDFSVRDVSVTKIDRGLEFVGTQIRKESDTPFAFDVRFVFGIDDIYVDGIEYDVSVSVNGAGEGNAKTVESKTVYRSIKADGKAINSWKYDEGDYFSAFTVDGVEIANASTLYTFRITPYFDKYNQAKGIIERDVSSATVTHIVTLNGLGETVAYATESSEWSDMKVEYTEISELPYKALGRTQIVGDALAADWSGAGIEFEANCIGNVYVNINAPYARLFTVVVDGVEYKDIPLSMGNNLIAQNLPYGKHSFKIMNQAGYNGIIEINGVTIRGEYLDAPDYSELFIEFIGDSITHGAGLGSPDYSEGINDGTLTYAFLAAKELGADYTIMANGGMGVLWGADYAEDNLNCSMKKYPYLNDSKRGDALYTGYMRAADLVVIGLSTNDNFRFSQQYTAEKNAFKAANPTASAEAIEAHMTEFVESKMALLKAELEKLIAEIEKNHSKDVPIILARGMMEYDDPIYLTSVTYMTKFIEEDWHGQYGDHVIKVAHLTPDRTGVGGHPKREGAAKQGAELAEFIRTEFPELVLSVE